ncbi:hypothetical protein ACFY9A_33555 [Streptomyces rubradiris]
MHVNSRVIVTGKLRPYGAARREVMPSAAWGSQRRLDEVVLVEP